MSENKKPIQKWRTRIISRSTVDLMRRMKILYWLSEFVMYAGTDIPTDWQQALVKDVHRVENCLQSRGAINLDGEPS